MSETPGEGSALCRHAQRAWASRPLEDRAFEFGEIRYRIHEDAMTLAEACAKVRGCSSLEALTSEVMPLLEAAAWLRKKGAQTLKSRKVKKVGSPIWLTGTESMVHRFPHGVVLVIGAGNYPLFLAGSQLLQALMAGNAVLVKPAPGATEPIRLLRDLLLECGISEELVTILPEDTESVHRAMEEGVDHVVFTGSAVTGRKIMESCARQLTPSTMELSGMDAFVILKDANPRLISAALRFGLSLNQGHTCVAPRRIFLPYRRGEGLLYYLKTIPTYDYVHETPQHLKDLLKPLRGKAVCGSIAEDGSLETAPLILGGLTPDHELVTQDQFFPIATVHAYDSVEEVVKASRSCRWALGASVFGDNLEIARSVARSLEAGVVTINDIIVPTADPRLPFGGRGESGFGVTRGPEGLLEMTRTSVEIWRAGRKIPVHLEDPQEEDQEIILSLMGMAHGRTISQRFQSLKQLILAGKRRSQK